MGTIDIYENKENKSVMMESHYIIAMDKSSFINEDINCDIGNGKFIWEKLSQLIRMISKGDLPNPESDPMLFIQVLKSHPICAGLKRVSNKEDTDINGYNIFGINVQHLGSESGMYCDDLLDTRECQIIRGETWKRLHGETETALVPFRCKEIPRRFPVLESCHNIDSIEGSLLESLLTPLEENCPFDPSFYKPSPYPALNVPFQTFSDHFFENVCFRSEKKEPTSLNLMKEALLLGARNYPKDVQSMIFDTFEQMSSIATPQQSECVLNVSNFNHVTNQSTLKMKQMAQQQQFRHYNLEQQQFHDRVQQQQQQQHHHQQQQQQSQQHQALIVEEIVPTPITAPMQNNMSNIPTMSLEGNVMMEQQQQQIQEMQEIQYEQNYSYESNNTPAYGSLDGLFDAPRESFVTNSASGFQEYSEAPIQPSMEHQHQHQHQAVDQPHVPSSDLPQITFGGHDDDIGAIGAPPAPVSAPSSTTAASAQVLKVKPIIPPRSPPKTEDIKPSPIKPQSSALQGKRLEDIKEFRPSAVPLSGNNSNNMLPVSSLPQQPMMAPAPFLPMPMSLPLPPVSNPQFEVDDYDEQFENPSFGFGNDSFAPSQEQQPWGFQPAPMAPPMFFPPTPFFAPQPSNSSQQSQAPPMPMYQQQHQQQHPQQQHQPMQQPMGQQGFSSYPQQHQQQPQHYHQQAPQHQQGYGMMDDSRQVQMTYEQPPQFGQTQTRTVNMMF
eukprot:TRINITY_DN221_c1_g1_i2.p1 TRINITY_DN221_c1_g1~~TRINITY_DN221_c1_g1_i2.p1  ORF type:complete len:721 (-),score=295.77 TRINITY_DN221_c1_g1_i2:225-2387(-)